MRSLPRSSAGFSPKSGKALGGDDAAALAEAFAQLRASCLAALPEPAPAEKKAGSEEPVLEKLFAAREARTLIDGYERRVDDLMLEVHSLREEVVSLRRALAETHFSTGFGA